MSYLALAKQAQALMGAKVSGPGAAIHTPEGAALITNLLRMPLDEFAHSGAPIAVRVPWYEDILWFVPAEAEVAALGREGIHRGRIWTAAELLELLSISGLARQQVVTVARAKIEFTGEVVMVTKSSCGHAGPVRPLERGH